jgi:hypothetical protein
MRTQNPGEVAVDRQLALAGWLACLWDEGRFLLAIVYIGWGVAVAGVRDAGGRRLQGLGGHSVGWQLRLGGKRLR